MSKIDSLPVSDYAKLVMRTIVDKKLTLESVVDFQKAVPLADRLFKAAMSELLEKGYLEWVPEKTLRRKAMYLGKAFLALGMRQIVKSYKNEYTADDVVKECFNVKNPAINGPNWHDKNKGFKNPHGEAKPTLEITTYQPYYVNSTDALKKGFFKVYGKTNKVPTAHLYRKAMARVCSTNVPRK